MARGNQTFKAAFLLDAKQFKAGVREIQGSLKSLKGSFMDFSSAIGVGLGMVSFISNLKDTAVKLSVAQNTLKNVSYETLKYKNATYEADITLDKYKENLKFVEGLSNKYGQSIITLTHEFAQFTAAANGLGISLDEQKRIYEALVRASATFHMSEDKTRDMIVAVTQMMSKGKITAEELRRQLGNHLPGAFNLMAKAAGVSTAKLEDMMKKGDALAVDLLPKFATELNKLTKDAHFDSLQTSLNRFGNAWVAFTQSTGFEGVFTKLVNAGTSALDTLAKHFNAFVWAVAGAFGSKLVMGMARGYNTLTEKGEDWFNGQQSQLKRTETQIDKLQEKLASTGEFLKTRRDSNYRFAPKASTFDKDLIKDLVEYNNLLIKQKQIRLEIDTLTTKEYKKLQTQIASLQQQNNKLIQTYQISQDLGRSFSVWQKLLKGAKVAIDGIKGTLLSMGITAIVSTIVGLIAKAVGKIKESREELERIKNIYSDYEKELKKSTSSVTAQEKQLYSLLKVIKDVKSTEEQRKTALNEIQRITGSNIEIKKLEKIEDAYDRIKQAVADWIELEKIKASISLVSQKNAEAQARNEEIATERLSLVRKKIQEEEVVNSPYAGKLTKRIAKIRVGILTKRINALNDEVKANNKILDDSDAKMQEFHKQMSEVLDAENNDYGDDEKGEKKLEGLAKVYSDYIKKEKELSRQLKEGAITQKDYNESFDKMVQSYFESAAGTGELSLDKIIEKLDNGKVLTKMEEWYLELSKLASKAITNASIRETGKILDKALKKSDKDWKEFLKKQEEKKKELEKKISKGTYNVEGPKNRNSLFDYDKTSSEIISEEFDIIQDWYKKVSDAFDELTEGANSIVDTYGLIDDKLVELKEQMDIAKYAANSLEEAMKFSKISEDIGALQKEMGELVYGGVKDLADSMDRVVSAANNLKDTMEDSDSSGWEKFMAVFNMISQVLDSAMGMYQSIQSIEENEAAIGAAKLAEQEALNELLKKEVALRMAANGLSDAQIEQRMASLDAMLQESGLLQKILDLSQKEKEATVANIAAKGAEAAVTAGAASASAGEAVANATASAAKMPFPYNLPAIAASIASVLGALANMNKFAKGGIVGGNSTRGDRNIIRANTGEMILNKAQQGTLFNILNGKGGMGSNVEFKIRGADLVGTINNYTSRKRG